MSPLHSQTSSPDLGAASTAGPLARRPRRLLAAALATLATLAVAAGPTTPTAAAERASTTAQSVDSSARQEGTTTWRQRVAADAPVAHLRGTKDLVTGQVIGTVTGKPGSTRMPNGATVPDFTGAGDHLTFPSRAAYSIAATGQLTVEYWMRPDNLQPRDLEGSGYVYVLGKGDATKHEWYGRMYAKQNSENRPNRISGYAFNPEGGLGAGSYFQDTVTVGQWIHVTLVFDVRPSTGNPMGTVKIYKNGVLRDTDGLDDYNITPRAGNAPFRMGTGYRQSFFEGGVGDVVFYNRALPASTILEHYRAMPR